MAVLTRRTRINPRRTVAPLIGAALALALAGCAGTGTPPASLGAARAGARLEAAVIHVSRDRATLAAHDSLALDRGTRITFLLGHKVVAAGEVDRFYDRDLRGARITSGSLAGVKRLDRLIVVVPSPPAYLPLLRVGYPARGRTGLLPICANGPPELPVALGDYRVDSLGPSRFALVRQGELRAAGVPDTVALRLFEEAADEEIALERGELDAAVFWPGELSSRMRSERLVLSGLRAIGVLFAVGPAASPSAAPEPRDSVAIALERDLFRGDLAPRMLGMWAPVRLVPTAADSTRPATAAWFQTDPTIPGHALIDRTLNRAARPSVPERPRRVRLFWLDVPPGAPLPDSLWRDPRRIVGSVRAFDPLCPVVWAPEARDAVRAIGVNALADLMPCRTPVARP